MSQITVGRHPTLGEVLDYYARDSFIEFLIETCRVRRVVMVISETMHWEPNWTADEVRITELGLGEGIIGVDQISQVRQFVLDKIQGALSGIGREGGVYSLNFYSELKNICIKL